ncbi:MAG: porin family protein [Bryobacteraceae bacterium]|jgi:opacity protein-like surface antigen
MRLLFLLLAGAAGAFCQPFSFGIKAGVPLTDFLNAAESQNVSYVTATNRFIGGVTAELHLPFGLGVEVDALYRHLNYQQSSSTVAAGTTASDFEFPLLGKYRFPKLKVVHPFVDAGVAFDSLAGVKQQVTTVVNGIISASSTSNPSELHNSSTRGFVIGGGIDIHFLVIHLLPEIRYTRWGAQHFFDLNGLLHSNVNQGEFLLGITF